MMYCMWFLQALTVQHRLEAVGVGGDSLHSPFQKLCDICITNDQFADKLLDHQNIYIATFAEYLNLTAITVASHDRNEFKYNCCRMLLSEMMTIAEEALHC